VRKMGVGDGWMVKGLVGWTAVLGRVGWLFSFVLGDVMELMFHYC
jgi:hypothetical protein